jgi:hypothetical protein
MIVRFTPRAVNDLTEIADYISISQPFSRTARSSRDPRRHRNSRPLPNASPKSVSAVPCAAANGRGTIRRAANLIAEQIEEAD